MMGERGSTLAGALVSLMIIGVALAILVAGLALSSVGAADVEKQVSAETCARRQMEAIKAAPYRPNPTVEPYPTVPITGPYTLTIEVRYWLSPTGPFVDTPPAEDSGLQRIAIKVYSIKAPSEPVFVLEDYKGERP